VLKILGFAIFIENIIYKCYSFFLILYIVCDVTQNRLIMLVPVKMNIRGTMVCTSLHEGRQVNKATLPIHIDQLFTLLFTNSKFFLDFHTARKTTGNKLIISLSCLLLRNNINLKFSSIIVKLNIS